jgi:iron complex outermembrane recepter protein
LRVTDAFRVRFGAAFLDTRYDNFPNAQCSSRSPEGITTQFQCDVSGNELTRSPDTTFNISPSYTVETGSGRFDATVNYVYNSGFFWEPDNRLKEPSYSLLSGQIGWTHPSESYGIKLFGKNLTNEKYTLWTVAFALGDEYAAAPPRTYGVEFNFKF